MHAWTFILSLTLAVTACQTAAPSQDPKAKQAEIIESQKAIIRNALDTGKPDLALQSLRGLLREFPNDASLQNLMGLTQLSLKNGARAAKHFQIAYRLDKQVATGLNLSSALIEAGNHATAIKLLNALQKQAERDGYAYKERIHHNLGYVYLREKKFAKAEEWFKQALEENPTFFPSHFLLAQLYESAGKLALSTREFKRASDYCLTCLEPVEALARLYTKTGKPADAKLALAQYLKIEGVTPEDRVKAGELMQALPLASSSPTQKRLPAR